MPTKKGNKEKKIYFSPEEWEVVCRRAEKVGKRTGTFIREIAVQGTVSVYDLELFNHLIISFNRIGSEVNQIAKVVNSTQSVYAKDIEDLKRSFKYFEDVMDNYLLPLKNEIII